MDVGVEVTCVCDAQDLGDSECCENLASEGSFAELAGCGGRLVSAFVSASKPKQVGAKAAALDRSL